MYTRCPHCKSVHPLDAAFLSHAHGSVRCGNCKQTFDALNLLSDQWPTGKAHGSTTRVNVDPPVLGLNQAASFVVDDSAENKTASGFKQKLFSTWGLAAVALVLLTMANLFWSFHDPLLQSPVLSSLLEKSGFLQQEPEGPLKTPEHLQLVSRDMHTHPTRSGILVLSLSFVNLAQHTQVFPVLEITLLDVANQPIAQRRFQPADYLRTGSDLEFGLATTVLMPVLLELADPGAQAVGFEIQFL